ncbi:DMT family transporter [Oceaniovalibus sp. ACAM 378]|uniref:DMT family transporter n=1 Tax=Oceaniovalibus sp. ACAM 378 TaxID=2599923 RepID=UPI00351ABD33
MKNDTKLGITLMICTTVIFALQDLLSRHLAANYNVYVVVMLRYWFFGIFAVTIATRRAGGLAAAARSRHPWVQLLRGLLLPAEICVMVVAFVQLGLVESHAIFAACPLLIAALSGPVLGERVGWRRWAAIGAGFSGILVILQPGSALFTPAGLIPLAAGFMFALYSLLTRYVARGDTAATSFFWSGVIGALAITPIGLWYWEPMTPGDQVVMAALCVLGALGHFLLIKVYEVAEASAVQPFAYLHLVFATLLGILVLGEDLRPAVGLGVSMVVAAGLFTLWRERRAKQRS